MKTNFAKPVGLARTRKQFLIIFLPVTLIIMGLSFAFVKIHGKNRVRLISSQESKIVQTAQSSIQNNLRVHLSDALFLSDLLTDYINNHPSRGGLRQEVGGVFLDFSKRRGRYDQVRYIDRTGMEVVRVNMSPLGPVPVPRSQLQNKSNRSYFKKTIGSKEGLYISQFDLNKEWGKIEKPIKPMLRFGAPVVDAAGRTHGAIVLNYLGADLLERVRKAGSGSAGKIYLVNDRGYYLIGPTSRDEWAFMRDGGETRSLKATNPGLWKRIGGQQKGQFIAAEGLVTFTRVCPTGYSVTGEQECRLYMNGLVEEHWTLMTLVPNEELKLDGLVGMVAFTGGVIVVLGLIAWPLASARVRHEIALEALKQSEGFNRAVLNSVTAHIAVLGVDGRIMATNKSWEDFVQIHFEDDPRPVVGIDYTEVIEQAQHIPYAQKKRIISGISSVLEGRQRSFSEEFIFVGQGIRTWFLLMVTPLGGDSGGAVVSRVDIEALKQAETAMAAAKEQAEATSRAKSEFLSTMSHEIRTPLGGIIGYTDLTLDSELDAEQRDNLFEIKNSAKRLLNLMMGIMDLAKLEMGKTVLVEEEFFLESNLDLAIEPFRAEARKKGLELELEVGPGVPEIMIGDGLKLSKTLSNMVENAVKFTDQGGIKIVVGVVEDGGTERLRFQVGDTGVGLTADQMECIFDPFCQVDSSLSRSYGGFGLGLAISDQLIRLMGGRLEVISEPGQGSVFSFSLPVGKDETVS